MGTADALEKPKTHHTSRRTIERYIAFLGTELREAMIELHGHSDLRYFVFPDQRLAAAMNGPPSQRAMVVLGAIGALHDASIVPDDG